MGRKKRTSFSKIATLFRALRFFYDKLPEKGFVADYQQYKPYLDKLRHFHGIGTHFYYVANLHTLKLEEVGGSLQKMTGILPSEIKGKNFAVGLKVFPMDQLIDILQCMIEYHEYVYHAPVSHRLLIKGSVILKVKNGQGGSFLGMLQAAPLALDSKGNVSIMFSSVTDVSHLSIQEDLIKVDIIDESDEEDIKIINILNKKQEVVLNVSQSEMRILNFLKHGKNNKEIAGLLCLSEHTVKNHRRNMIEKNKVKNTAELLFKAFNM